ncbi:MAG: GyrI-like domain-containing protein [Chloroflexota bacterium]|nr:GyrI-like domain-containing protein [Chloroflexota bacterium]
MSYQCELKEWYSQPTLAIRTRAAVQDLPGIFEQVYGAIGHYLGELGEPPAGPPLAAYHNMDMQDLDVEIGFPVTRELPGRDDIQAGQLPEGRVATCLHTGPYSDMEPAYAALSQWMEENGHEPTGVAYEMYLSDPEDTPPDRHQTQIAFPLK